MLNILETFDLRLAARWSAETLHLMIESMKRAFRDRAAYLGDPALNEIPAKLLDKTYARQLAATIDPERATPSAELAGGIRDHDRKRADDALVGGRRDRERPSA